MPLLRTAEFSAVPAATVLAALTDRPTVPDVLRRNGFRVKDAVGAHPSLLPGTELAVAVSWPRYDRVLRSAVFSTSLTDRAGGSLLTCSLDAVFCGGRPGDVLATATLRRTILAVLDATHEAVAGRVRRLVGLPAVVGAAVVEDGRVLAQQRRYPVADAGRWELPGGRVEPGETDATAIVRECVEELGVHVRPGARVGPDVELDAGMVLRVYAAELTGIARPTAREHAALRWLTAAELDTVDWLDADRALLPAVRALLGGDGLRPPA